jgi:glycine/D-amino acid oxidase-like deaminating enzyme
MSYWLQAPGLSNVRARHGRQALPPGRERLQRHVPSARRSSSDAHDPGRAQGGLASFGSLLHGTVRFEITTPDREIREQWLRRIETAMRDYLNLQGELHVVERWAGLRPTTPDGLPMIGRLASIQNLMVATGHAMLGLTPGRATGKVVAQLVSRKTPDVDSRALSPARFRSHARLRGRPWISIKEAGRGLLSR